MSNENSTAAGQSSPTSIPSENMPQTANTTPPQTNTPPTPKEDPFALDRRLIGELQKGREAPEHPEKQLPTITRPNPPEKK